jgi:hypothetical protein
VPPAAVVEDLEVFKQGVGQFDAGVPPPPVQQLDLDPAPERLDRASTAWGLAPMLVVSQYDPGPGAADPELTRALREPRPLAEIIDTVSGGVRSRIPELAVR